jgi:hypothetical protein
METPVVIRVNGGFFVAGANGLVAWRAAAATSQPGNSHAFAVYRELCIVECITQSNRSTADVVRRQSNRTQPTPMNRRILLLTIGLAFSGPLTPLFAQPSGPPAEAINEMAKLKFLTGSWQGDGWMEFAPGQKQPFKSREEVELKLDGIALLIEGIHHVSVLAENRELKVHHALASISYDTARKDYSIRAIKATGETVDARGQFKDGAFIWGFQDPRMGHMRFTIRLLAGKWHEIGERSADGKAWTKYLEMNLSKSDRQ